MDFAKTRQEVPCGEPAVEVPVLKQLDDLMKTIADTHTILSETVARIIGAETRSEKPLEDPKSINELLFTINVAAEDSMALAHRIYQLLF